MLRADISQMDGPSAPDRRQNSQISVQAEHRSLASPACFRSQPKASSRIAGLRGLGALQAPQQYLATIATEQCAQPAAPPPQTPPGRQRKTKLAPLAAVAPPPVIQPPAVPDPQLSEADRRMNSRN